jgi:MFS family permease
MVAATLVPRARPATGSRVLGARERPRSPRPSARVVVVLGLTLGLGSAPALAAFAHAGVLVGDAVPVAAAVALLNLGNVAGRLLAGQAADRIGHRPALHGAAILSVAGCLPLADGRTGSAALVAVGVLGTAYGAFSTLVPTATADVVPADRFGTAYGRVFTGWGVAGLLAPTGSSALADASDYGPAYQVLLGAALLTWLCIAVLGRLARPAAPR